MDRDRNAWAENIYPGSLQYINVEFAHRLDNTGQASYDLVHNFIPEENGMFINFKYNIIEIPFC